MAQLKDTLIQGSARVTDALYANDLNVQLLTPSSATYTTSINAGISFLNGTSLIGHMGASIGGSAIGSLGLMAANALILRTGATVGNNDTFDSTTGINFTTTDFSPITNNTISLGTSTNHWSNGFLENLTLQAPSAIEGTQNIKWTNSNTECGKITTSTTGALTLFSKRILLLYPGNTRSSANPVADYQTTKGIVIGTDTIGPAKENDMILGSDSKRWLNVYSVNGNFNGEVTISNAGGFKYTGLQAATSSLSIDRPLWIMAAASASALSTGVPVYNTNLTYNAATNALKTGGSIDGLTLTAATTGFTIAGGTTSKTLTVSGTATINAPTQWGIVYGGASGAYTSTAAGTSGQYLKSNGSAAPTWSDFNSMGKAGWIAYPESNTFTVTGSPVSRTGALKITIPQAGSQTMISFDVHLYGYATSADSRNDIVYHIAAYDNTSSWGGAIAYVEGKGPLTALNIRFASDENDKKCVIIGEIDTVWSYPFIAVHNVHMAFKNTQYSKWATGWNIEFIAALPASIDYTIRHAYMQQPFTIKLLSQTYASNNHAITMAYVDGSQTIEEAYIGAGTGGSLGIASKAAIALWPGSTSATAVADFQSTQGIRFFKDRCEPCPNSTYSLGETNSRFTNVYATNLYGTLNTTDINGVDATNGSLEKTLNQKGNWITNKRIFFGTCDTVAATTTKAVTCAEFSSDDLVDGTIISVRFTYKNSGAVASLMLNVNSTGEYPIKKMYASTGLTDLNNAAELGANGVVTFVFNKISDITAYWQVVGLDYNTNTNTNVTQDFSTATNYPRPLLLSNYTLGQTSTSAAIAYRNDQIYANAGLGALYATSFHGALDYNDLTHTNATAGQVLTVNSTADGLVWATPSTGVSLASQTTQVYLTGAAQTTDTSLQLTAAYVTTAGALYSTTVHNAVWNDYAEYRAAASYIEPGRVVIDTDNGEVILATKRLQPGAQVVSDTWGHIMGETNNAKTPIAVAGRVLVYPYKDRKEYHAGMCVCSAPNGTVDIMTRDEIREYPDCIIGTVSEIPEYEYWGSGNVEINERIWVKVR